MRIPSLSVALLSLSLLSKFFNVRMYVNIYICCDSRYGNKVRKNVLQDEKKGSVRFFHYRFAGGALMRCR